MECTGGRRCYMFASKEGPIPDGTRRFPQLCLDTPPVSGAPAGHTVCGKAEATLAPLTLRHAGTPSSYRQQRPVQHAVHLTAAASQSPLLTCLHPHSLLPSIRSWQLPAVLPAEVWPGWSALLLQQ
eukprot:GHRQ01016468.1.p2 GENE.GHRQ01016468.1~~GHRQ01016468.1.p2  ORF type:complete len:126 (+),score=36.09 GHRQ01016468.1:1033-1410(+)